MAKKISILSWNVNGIRAAEKKGFIDFLENSPYDIVAIQETKVSHPELLSDKLRHPKGFNSYWQCDDVKKGYSGVAVYSKLVAEKVVTQFPGTLSKEGRVIELHFKDFIFLNIYFPNGGSGSERLKYKLEFYKVFVDYVNKLKKIGKPIVFCGDVNTAHTEIDLARPKQNENTSGFMSVERAWLDRFVKEGFIDTFRLLHPEEVKYSWWDLKTGARARNVGWRIDYFYTTSDLKSKIKTADILTEVYNSDHAPVILELAI